MAAVFALALLGFLSAAAAGTVTLQFSNGGIARATGFSNSAAVTGIDGMRWGLIVDTQGDGFRPGEYDGGFSMNTSGFLTVNGVPTNDYYVAHPSQVVTFTSGTAGTDPGGPGTITTITSVPYDGGTAITSGDPFQLVWFETGTSIGQKYGMLGNTSDIATFVIPGAGATQPYSAFFAGAVADPIRGTTLTLAGSTIGPIANTTILEDTSTTALPFTVGAVGTLSASSSNTTLVPDGNLSLGGSGTSRTITAMPAPNQNGSATITVVDITTTQNRTFTLTVTAVNDVPSFIKGADQSVLKNTGAQSLAGWATAISSGPANESGQTLDFIVSNNNNALFSAQPAIGADGTLTYTPVTGGSGSANVTVQIHDNGGVDNNGVDTSAAQTFTIAVIDPALVVTSTADTGAGSLRQALTNAAAAGGAQTITFSNGVSGPMSLSSEIVLNTDVTIDGGSGVEIRGNGGRLFTVSAGRTVTLKNLTLTNGNGTGGGLNGVGGAIHNQNGATLSLENCTLSGHSTNIGGAIFNNGGVLMLNRCTFSGNSAISTGGAIHSVGTGSLTALGCTFFGNTATGSGGALYTASTASLIQCTFSGNTGQIGGGVYNQNSGMLTLTHCTLSLNTASGAGGGIYNSLAAVTLTNCIVAENTAATGADIMNSGSTPFGNATVTRVGVNIVISHLNNGNTASDSGPAALNVAPLLNALGDNGGPTQTMVPQPTSPAIDQASVLNPALTTDQRGFPRPLGVRPDIGAVEGTIIVVTTPVDELDAPGVLGAGISLREALRDAAVGGAVITFDRAVFSGLTPTTNTITLTKGPLPGSHCTLYGTPNPGGITLVNVPTITTQPQPLSLASGATATFTAIATDVSQIYTYRWRKNGVDINTSFGPTLTLNNISEADEAVYDVRVFRANLVGPFGFDVRFANAAEIVSQPASLIVDGALLTIKRDPSSAMLALGSSYTLRVDAIGPATPALTYQWTLNGKNISGATKASYLIAKAALTNAGTYICVVKSGTTPATSAPAEIGVVDTTPKTVNLLASPTASFTATVNAAGNGPLTFAWLKNGGGTAFNAKSFTLSKPVLITDSGLYTCTVTGAAGVFTGGAPTQLNVSNAAPQLVLPLAPPAATIGQAYFYQLPVQSIVGAPATSFSVTGALPAGITFNTTTGVLSGRPTATKTGGYALSFKAINAKSSSVAAPATLTVNVVPPNAVGVFAGPIERSTLNDNLGGRFDLTTTAAGGFSGSLTLGARTKLGFTAQLLQSAGAGDVILYGKIPGLTMSDKTPLTAYIEVFAVEQIARLTLIHPNGTTLVIPAWRNQWDKTKLASIYAAYYTMRLDPQDLGTAPRGYGYASFTVKPDGTLTLAGKLPDGSDVTGGTFVGPDGQIPLFNLLYANRGSHVGQFTLTPASPVTNNVVNGTTSWFKPAPLTTSTDTVYKAGFGPLTVTAAGGVYVPPAKGLRVMGLLTVPNPNAKLSFTLGGLAPEFTQLLNIVNPSATGLTNTNVITAPITNTTKLPTLDAAKGLFAGSFQINGATTALHRPAPFLGQIVKIGATTQGYGYFLLPAATPKISTSPKLSGRVVLGVP